MFVNSSDFIRAMKSAWKIHALKIQKLDADGEAILVIESPYWKWQCAMEEVSRKILATIIELCGFIPEVGERWQIGKDMDPQMEIEQGITWINTVGTESRLLPIVMQTKAAAVRFLQSYNDETNKITVKTIQECYASMITGKPLKTEERTIYCKSTENYVAFSDGNEQLSIYYYEIDPESEKEYSMYQRLEGLVL